MNKYYHSMQFIPDDKDIYRVASDHKTLVFNGRNTWKDWRLIPVSRPLINPPTVKTNYIDIPGGHGTIDASEILTNYPLYNNREGSNEFYVIKSKDEVLPDPFYKNVSNANRIHYSWMTHVAWAERYSQIMDYLHGRAMKVILDDDPGYYYYGRVHVNSWKSEENWSKIVIDYHLDPFKYEILTTLDDWLWDPFSFVSGVIHNKSDYMNLQVGGYSDESQKATTVEIRGGTYPAIPEITVAATTANTKIKITKCRTTDGGEIIPSLTKTITLTDTAPHTYKFYDFRMANGETVLQFRPENMSNVFIVTVKYRGGRL